VVALLERDRELGAIRDGLAKARRGDGRSVLVEGPAGIGKSALLLAARTQARDAGFRVLSAAGGELETDFPYGVVRQLFEPELTGEPEAESLLAGAAALARPVLAVQNAPRSRAGDSYGLEALHGLYWLTVNLAAASPVFLAVDDVHWCDGPSLRFLLYLRRRLEGLPLLLLLAVRPGEPGGEQGLLSLLIAGAAPHVVRPGALSREAVAALLRVGLSDEPDPVFTASAHVATNGNPFLLRGLITDLAEREVRPTADAARRLSTIGAPGVRRAVLRRLVGLGEGAIGMARAVAVFGADVDLRSAAELAELDEEVGAEVVEALVRIQILRDERTLSFVHPLVRAAIYADVPATARARAHARAARIMARAGAEPDAVAAHLLETEASGDPAVVEHLRAAARRAAEQGATDIAATYLRRGLAEPPAGDLRAVVLRELGAAELAGGQPDAAAERLAAAAREAPDLDAQVRIGLMRRHSLVLADRIAEAVSVLDELRELSDDPDLIDLLEAGALGAGQVDFAVVRGLDDRLTRLRARAREATVREPLALAVAAYSAALANGPLVEIVSLTDRALAALPHAHPASDYTFEAQLAVALYLSEQFDRALDFASGRLEDARRRGSLPRFISMAQLRSAIAYRTGALADAQADAHDALEATRLHGHQFWLPPTVAAMLNPLVEQGGLDEAERLLADTRVDERHGRSNSLTWAAVLLPARGRLRVAEGRIGDGLADLLACGERYESGANRSPSLWAWRSEAALALVALGDHDRAHELAAEELRLARELGTPRALGVSLRAAGLVDGAIELLKESAAVLARSGAVLEHARALVDLGVALRRARRPSDARLPLREGLELAVRCGAAVLAQRARDELLATGARPRRDRLSGPEALTASERRVARMAAEGKSNPEIAQALFLTRRTVETHLTHTYQKLGIGSREELTTALSASAPPDG
jgi:DNA-binding CsgD family transcriptional regulator/tetratricopeptide (TPR) repeat protein